MKTTLEKAKENNHDTTVSNLQTLLEKNYDAEKGFKKALQNTQDTRLKQYLQQKSAQRARFVTELDNEIRNLNETPKESGSTTGTLHRTWMDIKTTFTGNDDEAVLSECIRGEKASIDAYSEILKENRFTPSLENTLQRQKNEIQKTVSTVKKLEDISQNWTA